MCTYVRACKRTHVRARVCARVYARARVCMRDVFAIKYLTQADNNNN